MRIDEYARYDATSLAEIIRDQQVDARDLLQLAIEAAESLNSELNAICEWFVEDAIAEINSLDYAAEFAGVPFLIKDLILQVRGRSCTQGSLLVDERIAVEDSVLMSRFRQAGLIAFGKTTTPAFGAHVTTESLRTGNTCNPWNRKYSSGGSSGGAAAAVAAGIVPIAHASDALGSIRIPASACHVFGLKPTAQRTPTGPHYGHIAGGRGVEFVISRSVRDSARLLDLTHGPDPGAPHQVPPPLCPYSEAIKACPKPLRIAFTNRGLSGARIADDCCAAVEKIALICTQLGHNVCQRHPIFNWEEYSDGLQTIVSCRLYASIEAMARTSNHELSETSLENHLFALYQDGARRSAKDMINAESLLAKVQRQFGIFFDEFDILLTPTLSRAPAKIGELTGTSSDLASFWRVFAGDDYSPFAGVFNVTGQPAASIPSMINGDGLPIGVQAAAPYGREDFLLALAAQIEEAAPWIDQRPPIFAGITSPEKVHS